jgi:hypothetical protein
VDWGDVPTWVGSIGTFLLVLFAGIAARWAAKQLKEMQDQTKSIREANDENREELKRLRARQDEADRVRARAQAGEINVVADRYWARLDHGPNPDVFLTLTVNNESLRPIRGLRCKADQLGGDKPTVPLADYLGRVRNSGGEFDGRDFIQDKSLRSPMKLLRSHEACTFLLTSVAKQYPNVRFWVQFQDDAGLWWELDSDMHLIQIEAAERWSD